MGPSCGSIPTLCAIQCFSPYTKPSSLIAGGNMTETKVGSSFLRRSGGSGDDRSNGRRGIFSKLPSLRISFKRKSTTDTSKAASAGSVSSNSSDHPEDAPAIQSLRSNIAPLSPIALGMVESGAMLARITSKDVVSSPSSAGSRDKTSIPTSAGTDFSFRMSSSATASSSGQWTAITTPDSAAPMELLSSKDAGVLPSIRSQESPDVDECTGKSSETLQKIDTHPREPTEVVVRVAEDLGETPDLSPLYPKIEAQVVELSKQTKSMVAKEISKSANAPTKQTRDESDSPSPRSNSNPQIAVVGKARKITLTKDDASRAAFGASQASTYYARPKTRDTSLPSSSTTEPPSSSQKIQKSATFPSARPSPSTGTSNPKPTPIEPLPYPGHDTWSTLPRSEKRKTGAKITSNLSTYNWSTALQRRQPQASQQPQDLAPEDEIEEEEEEPNLANEKRFGRIFLFPENKTEKSNPPSSPSPSHIHTGSIDLDALNSAQVKAASFEKMSSRRKKTATAAASSSSSSLEKSSCTTARMGSLEEREPREMEEEERNLTLWRTNSRGGGEMFVLLGEKGRGDEEGKMR